MTIEEEEDQDIDDNNNADGGDEVGPSTAGKGCFISL